MTRKETWPLDFEFGVSILLAMKTVQLTAIQTEMYASSEDYRSDVKYAQHINALLTHETIELCDAEGIVLEVFETEE